MNQQAALFSMSCERNCLDVSIALRYLIYLDLGKLPMSVVGDVDIKYVSTLAATGLISAQFFPPPCNKRRYEKPFDVRVLEITDAGREEVGRLKDEHPACVNAVHRSFR